MPKILLTIPYREFYSSYEVSLGAIREDFCIGSLMAMKCWLKLAGKEKGAVNLKELPLRKNMYLLILSIGKKIKYPYSSLVCIKKGRLCVSVKTIKKILAEDAEAFLKYRKQIAVETTNTLQYEGMKLPTSEEMAKKILAQAEDKSSLNLGVFIENEIIAALNFRKVMPDHPWCQHIASFGMGVLKAYWGQGLGTKLLLQQEEHALKNGVTRIEAYVRLVNERGINLYTKNGYLIEGKRKNAAIINGEYHDEYFIAKILTSHD